MFVRVCVCAKAAKQISVLVVFLCSPHKKKASHIHLLPLILEIHLFPEAGDLAATPRRHLPCGIKGWLSCYCLSQRGYLPLAAAHCDTCFHSLTHTRSPLILRLSPHLSLFISTCCLICLATAGKLLCIGKQQNVKSSPSIFIG